MAHDVNQVKQMPAPYLSVDEQVFVVEENGCLDFQNDYFKFIFMYEGECLHQIDDEPPRSFASGDAIVFPRTCRQRYWPMRRNTSPRLHALRVLFEPEMMPPNGGVRIESAENRKTSSGPMPVPLPGGGRGGFPDRSHGAIDGSGVDCESDLIAFLRKSFREIQHLSCRDNPAVMQLAREIRTEAEREAPAFRLRVAALCTEMVVMFARQLRQLRDGEQEHGQSAAVHLVSQSKEYMVRNLAQSLSLAKIAAHVRVSPEHLARSFKRGTGLTALEYLHRVRVEKAKDYLISSGKSLGEIAALTGFSTLALFSRGFKRHAGVNPSAYRRKVWSNRASFRMGERTPPRIQG